MKSLWPNLNLSDLPKTPISILKEQTASLAIVTKNIVHAELKTINGLELGYDINQAVLDFNLVSPLLDNYQYNLFRAIFDLKQNYPVTILLDEAYNPDLCDFTTENGPLKISNERELEAALEAIFHSRVTINILTNLINMSAGSGS